MGFFDKLFSDGKKKEATQPKSSSTSIPRPLKREDQADIYFIPNEAERMNWAIEKAPGHLLVYILHIYPAGRRALSKLNTIKTDAGWRVLAPEST